MRGRPLAQERNTRIVNAARSKAVRTKVMIVSRGITRMMVRRRMAFDVPGRGRLRYASRGLGNRMVVSLSGS